MSRAARQLAEHPHRVTAARRPAVVHPPRRRLLQPGAHELALVTARRVPMQAKLTLEPSDSPLEREADDVAARVVARQAAVGHARECGCGGTCPQCRAAHELESVAAARAIHLAERPGLARQADEDVESEAPLDDAELDELGEDFELFPEEEIDESEPDESGMPKRKPGADVRATHVRVPDSGGEPLAPDVRERFEAGLGADLGTVRLHTDAAAAASARAAGAQAYTVGSRIVFDAGRYDPETAAGSRLLAHELVHVVQQTGGRAKLQLLPERGRRRRRRRTPRPRSSACPQGKQPRVVRNDCATSGPADSSNFITHLAVSLSGRTVTPTWRGTPQGSGAGPWECSPNPTATPTTGRNPDHIGTKCSINHTNRHRDGMAWFTSIARHGLRIGFHDSQPVGPSHNSHGCVRIRCPVAKTIHDHTSSGVTTVRVS